MDFSLNKEQQMLRENVIAFARNELNSGVVERDSTQSFPSDLWLKCGEQKLQGLTVTQDMGGAGLDPLSAIIALESLGYASEDGGLNFALCAHFLSCVTPILKFGSEDQKKKYLPLLSAGKKIIVNAMTESESGSDAFNMKTTATIDGEGFILNGKKAFTSNGPHADLVLVYAITDHNKGFFGGITAFIIDIKTRGISRSELVDKMGLRSCNMCEIIFENVKVSKENVLGNPGSGATIFNYSMEWERTGMSACHIGTMERLLELTIRYAQKRMISGQPLSKKQSVAHRIANMKTQLEAGRMLTLKAASGLNTGSENALNASIAKLFVSEAFTLASMEAIQIHGGNGFLIDTGIERILRDSVGSTIYSGTSDIQRNLISGWLGL